jgi:acyl-CoA thioester hydrolase
MIRCSDVGKTGFSGIVYHANDLRFMERGRTNYLRLLGADQRVLFAEAESEAPGFAFVVRSMQLEFLKPAKMDDLLDVATRKRRAPRSCSRRRSCAAMIS